MVIDLLLCIDKVIVQLMQHGTDRVSFVVNHEYPSPICCLPNELLHLSFDVIRNKGIEYVRNNFGIDPEILDCRRK